MLVGACRQLENLDESKKKTFGNSSIEEVHCTKQFG